MKLREALLAALVFIFVLLYELSAFFLDLGMGYVNYIKNALIIGIAIILFRRNRKMRTKLPFNVAVFLAIMAALLILQFVGGYTSDIVSPVIYLAELYIVVKFSDAKFIRYFFFSILLITLLSSIPVLYYYALTGYYARDSIMFDKSMQTFLFGFSYVLLLMELIALDGRRKKTIFTVLIYLILVNVFVLQSKTSISVLFLTILIMFLTCSKQIRGTLSRFWKSFVAVLVVLALFPIKWEIPDALKQFINIVMGKTMFVLERDMREDTYEIRGKVFDKTLSVLNESPFLGAGFGNQETVLRATGTGVSQAESQLMGIALDGGITYLIAFAILILPMFFSTIRSVHRRTDIYSDQFVLFQVFGFLFLCVGNEMLSSLGWFFIGSLIYIHYTKSSIRLLA